MKDLSYGSVLIYAIILVMLIEIAQAARENLNESSYYSTNKIDGKAIQVGKDRQPTVHYTCNIRSASSAVNLIGLYSVLVQEQHDDRKVNMGHLVCLPRPSLSVPRNFIYTESTKNHNYSSICPGVIDYLGQYHSSNHLCVVPSKQDNVCIFSLNNTIVSVCGGFLDLTTLLPYSFFHSSMGLVEPTHYHEVHFKWMTYYTDNVHLKTNNHDMKVFDLVIPLRMIWDTSFGHLYHQSVPFIAHIYQFLSLDIINKATWHCSVPTAALLLLLDIPLHKIVAISKFQRKFKQQPIIAKQLIFPWLRGWCPSTNPSLRGIAAPILENMTNNLLRKYNYNVTQHSSEKRSIIYLARSIDQTRYVVNQNEIINLLQNNINTEKYNIIILNQTNEYHNVEDLHWIWYKSAIHFVHARVIIGSHGSAFGNIMWTPDDTDFIEFNVFPDDPVYTQASSKCHHRASLISAAWAKGGQSRIFNIDPSMKSMDDFYESNIRVSPYELLAVLRRIGDDIIKRESLLSNYLPEKHEYWS